MLSKYKISALLLLLFPVSLYAGNEKDVKTRQYKDVMYLENIWYGSLNPVSISFVPLTELFDLGLNFGISGGDFRNVADPAKENSLEVGIFGMKKLKKISFEGGIGYQNKVERERKWNSTLFIAPTNPFILADSVAGKFNVEKFTLNGGFSLDISSRIKLGLRANYESGSAADQTDPRPDTKSMRFVLNPGVNFRIGKEFAIGVSSGIRLLSESVKYTSVVGGVNHLFFLFNGLGSYYPGAGTAYERQYKGQAYSGDVQFVWDGRNGLSNFLEGGLEYATEDARDGGAQREFKGGKYKSKLYSVSNRFQMKGDRFVHNLTPGIKIQQVDGIWYDQKDVIDENGNTYWIVVSNSVKHKEDRMTGTLAYRLDLLRGDVPDLTFCVNGHYLHSETTNYPELQKQKYAVLSGDASVTIFFNIRKYLLGVVVAGGYNKGSGRSLESDGIKIVKEYSRPAFEYLSGDSWNASGEINAKMPLDLSGFNAYIGAFARFTTWHYAGDYEYLKNTVRNRINVGVNFSF